jgi:hypothetical protein
MSDLSITAAFCPITKPTFIKTTPSYKKKIIRVEQKELSPQKPFYTIIDNFSAPLKFPFQNNNNPSSADLPTPTSYCWCWWDQHEITDKQPIAMPIYNEHTKAKRPHRKDTPPNEIFKYIEQSFTFRGNFCSWPCAKSYAQTYHPKYWRRSFDIFFFTLKKAGITDVLVTNIPDAPHWSCLQRFDGPLSIGEFRTNGINDRIIFSRVKENILLVPEFIKCEIVGKFTPVKKIKRILPLTCIKTPQPPPSKAHRLKLHKEHAKKTEKTRKRKHANMDKILSKRLQKNQSTSMLYLEQQQEDAVRLTKTQNIGLNCTGNITL